MKKRKLASLLLSAALILTATGCSQAATPKTDEPVTSAGTAPSYSPHSDAEIGGDVMDGGAMFDESLVAGDVGFGADGMEPGGEENGIKPEAGLLTAGEWIDNDHWTFWQNLYQLNEQWELSRKTWNKSFVKRYFVTVTNGEKPVENVTVKLVDANYVTLWEAKTDNEGKCYLFIDSASNNAAKITADVSSVTDGVVADTTHELDVVNTTDVYTFNISDAENAAKALDLMLVFDTTGSMGDELTYLQTELEDVVNKVVGNNANLPTRLSVNFYRDAEDDYVIRPFAFTSDLSQVISDLRAQSSNGGGDMPEYVNGALNNAINEHDWSEESTKLLFIILDAPPHSDSSEAVAQMNSLAAEAAAKGIRIIPIVSSGADKETEYLMRDLAIKTGGTYIFLTGDSGIGGEHMIPTTGEYVVEKLNDLLVRVIDRYLAVNATAAQYKDIEVEVQIPEETTTEPENVYPGGITAMDIVGDDGVVTHYTYEAPETQEFVEWALSNTTEYLDKEPELSDNITLTKYVFYLDDGSTEELSVTSDRRYVCWDGEWYEVVPGEVVIYDDVE